MVTNCVEHDNLKADVEAAMGINVLSLFDGISCGQIALGKLGIEVENYFASEIDEYTIQVAKHNYPNTKHIGDVAKIKGSDLPKIDLLMGGSPCQGFSLAGKCLNFDDPRSKLFFEYMRLLKECSPNYFLLENVRMKKEYQDIITKYLGVEPILINSARLTAQDRKRLYWTNIPHIEQPNDKGVYLKDILDTEVNETLYVRYEAAKRYTPTENYTSKPEKSCVIGKLSKHQGDRVFDVDCKASCLLAVGGSNGGKSCNIIHDPQTGRLRRLSITECERLQGVPNGYIINGKSKQAMYKALGNSWTVDVIVHIFKRLLENLETPNET